ncbi:vitellogenin-like [Argopecten irradians]|uniref:vitellogenin-like n=1 Tax=Argopecten irradians TaxID=31199 RepID=UPI003714BFE3
MSYVPSSDEVSWALNIKRGKTRTSSPPNSEHNCQQDDFIKRIATSASCAISDRRGMTFEHAYGPDKSIRSQAELEEKLMDICRNTQQDIRPETPQFFSDLVYLMKTVDSQALRRVYQKLRTGSLCPNNIKRVRKFFLDAIPMAGTSSSLSMLTELINNDEITGVEADMWLTTLSFIQHPTKDMLREVMPLLSRNNGKAMLAVTSLVHNFCRKRTCDNDMEVRSIISTIEGKIEYGCNVDGDRLQKTIMSLRALGNSGHATSAVSTINTCLTRTENPTDVRLAAIEAFRRSRENKQR